MKRFGLAISLLLAGVAIAGQSPTSAGALVHDAMTRAQKENKTVLVRFTASWCGWCHKMQSVLDQPAIKAIWDKHFVSVPIIVLENGEKEQLENPGGEALMDKAGGKNSGIPFFYFADAKTGKMIINSSRPAEGADKGGNVGCPYEPAEIGHFMNMLKKAVPSMTAAERTSIQSAFEALKKGR